MNEGDPWLRCTNFVDGRSLRSGLLLVFGLLAMAFSLAPRAAAAAVASTVQPDLRGVSRQRSELWPDRL